MSWRLAESLKKLRVQLNAVFPKRSKASDGTIGDKKHSARTSDHNPNSKGVVCAIDFTHDPKTGIDCQWLADTLTKHKDPRIKYLIWNKQICSSKNTPWKWRNYSGVNAHTKHLHVSVEGDAKLYDSNKEWQLTFPKNTKSDVAKISNSAAASSLSNDPTVFSSSVQLSPGVNPTDLSEPAPQQPPIISTPVAVAAVPALSTAPTAVSETSPTTEEGTLTKIGNKLNAAYTAVGTVAAGVIAWFSNMPGEVVLYVMGAVVVLGLAYMIFRELRGWRDARYARDDKRIAEEREFELKKLRESHVQEAQMYSMRSVAEKDLVPVTIVQPPTMQLSHSDSRQENV